MRLKMIIFCDIDGILTDDPVEKWGEPHINRIELIKEKIKDGHTVVVWSGNGTQYAESFCKLHGINAKFSIGKPDIYIYDKKGVMYSGFEHVKPEEMVKINWEERYLVEGK
jgi:hypothetical protein